MPEVGGQGNIPDVSKEVEDLKANTKKDRNDIENVLKKAYDNLEARKQELYIEKLNSELNEKGKTIKSYDDLTVAQRKELENFVIPEAEMDKMIDGTAEEIQKITTLRNDDINNFEDRIQKLYAKAQKKVEELSNELQNSELKEDERNKIQEELNQWQDLMDKIGPEKGAQSPIRKSLTAAIKNHDEGRMNGVKGMTTIYPKDRVMANDKVMKIVPENQREDFMKEKGDFEAVEKDSNEKQNENKDEEEKNNLAKAAMAAKAAQQMAGPGQGDEMVSPETGEGTEKPFDYLTELGFDADRAMNFDYACDVLGNFAKDEKFTDRQRMEMLNNPEVKNLLESSLKVAGNNLNPLKARQFNETRNKVLKLAGQNMKIMAIQSMGKDVDYYNIKKQFNDLNNEYIQQKNKLEERLNGELDDADRANVENELNELNARYNDVRNVSDFSKSTNKIKTLKTRFNSFKDALFKKGSYSPKLIAEKAGQAKDTIVEKAGQAKDAVGNYMFENYKSQVKSPEERAESYAQRESNAQVKEDKQKTNEDKER